MRFIGISCAILALLTVSTRAEAAQCRTGHAGIDRHNKECTLKNRLEVLKTAAQSQR